MKSKFLILLLCAMALFAGRGKAQDDARVAVPNATWQVLKYDLSVTLPTAETDRGIPIKATLSLKNVSAEPAQALTLRIAQSVEITSVTFNGSPAEFSKREEKVDASRSLQRVSIRIPSVAAGASAAAVVEYRLTIKDNSGTSTLSPIGAQLLPQSFWYPTPNSWFFARGADYAPVRLSVTSPGGLTIVSSGTTSGQAFEQKLNAQPFFIAGNWETASAGGSTVYFPKGMNADAQTRAAELAAVANEARAFAAGLLGPGPDVPVRLVAARRGSGFSDSGVVIVDEGIFRRPKLDSQTVMNVAEAIAKTWIGSAVAVNGIGQGTIREGLPRFIATEFIEARFGKEVADVERARQRSAYAAIVQRDEPLATVSPVSDYYYSEVANKGAMFWRLLDRRLGRKTFFETIAANIKDGQLDLTELRAAFSAQKELVDHLLEQVTDTNLMVGLPQTDMTETKAALRNTGGIDATVTVKAWAASGETLSAQATVRARSFGEVNFKTAAKIVRLEIDSEKLYPQIDYSDDIAPREFTEGDRLLAVKRLFDKQDLAGAETAARSVLRDLPRYDDVRIYLARALLALNRPGDAEREFKAVLDEKLPTARSLAWANLGLAEVSARSGQSAAAIRSAEAAIVADADYGASLAARALRSRLSPAAAANDDAKAYFARFDKAAVSNRKAEVDALLLAGEAAKFASGVSGSTEQWQTQVLYADRLAADTMLVEAKVSVKLLNRDPEAGTAVFRLERTAGGWKLAAVEMFEVR
ncbi:MAG: tetratricopeptide repeat protein [Pyrinomonadaceae bacterium]